jgi:hypothetical protein
VEEWQRVKVAKGQSGKVAKWQSVKVAKGQSGKVAKCESGKGKLKIIMEVSFLKYDNTWGFNKGY